PSGGLEVVVAFGGLDLGPYPVELFLVRPPLIEDGALRLPIGLGLADGVGDGLEFLFDAQEARRGFGVLFAFERLALDLKLQASAPETVDLFRHALELYADAAGGLVD